MMNSQEPPSSRSAPGKDLESLHDSVLETFDETQLAKALAAAIQTDPWRIPVLAVCEAGGWPEPGWVERVRLVEACREGGMIRFVLVVSFEERVPKCCSDFGLGDVETTTYGIPRVAYFRGILDERQAKIQVIEPVRDEDELS